jgi:hypothetical protein
MNQLNCATMLWIVLTLCSCANKQSKPLYKYGDWVIRKDPFFENCKYIVENYSLNVSFFSGKSNVMYSIRSYSCSGDGWVYENEIELLRKAE